MGDFSEGLKLWKQIIDWTYLIPNVNIGNWTLSYCKQINLDDVVYCVHVTYWKWNTTSYFWCKIVIYHTHVDCISHCHFCNCACLLSVSEFVCVVWQRLVAWLDKLYWYAQKYVETYAGGFLLTTTKLKVWLATQNQFNFTMKSNANFQFKNAFIFRKKLSILLMAETIFIYWLHEICLLYPVICNRDSHRINMYFVD